MRTSALFLSGLGAVTTALAQDIQSKPFHLVARAPDNKDINGRKFTACHTGAAIETLCLTDSESEYSFNSTEGASADSGSEFYFNSTEGASEAVDGYGPPGVLGFTLPLGDGQDSLSQTMSFYVDPATNVALPLFLPDPIAQPIVIGKECGELGILNSVNDTVKLPQQVDFKVLKNWYVCETLYAGYQYQSLSWALGKEDVKPQNPSCVKVQVAKEDV